MKPLPIGISDFAQLRNNEYYYVDKTGMISDFFRGGAFTLFTRPRRFGKSLNLSMFHYFLEIGASPELFQGLRILEDTEIVKKHMGRYPVIHLSFKDVTGCCYKTARNALASAFGEEASRFLFLLESPHLSAYDVADYKKLIRRAGDESQAPFYDLSDEVLTEGLKVLSRLLRKHYKSPCVILLDEYDVPLDKAYNYGYYDQILPLIRMMISGGLKDNPNVNYALVTGCLRIAKESIFTGINNLSVNTILNVRMDEYFGFTEPEVEEILQEYQLEKYRDAFRQKYDGYFYGKKHIYNPWDVLCAANSLAVGKENVLENFWADSGSNLILRRMMEFSRSSINRRKIQALMDGETIRMPLNQSLTYPEIYQNLPNLWTVMLMAGFLTPVGEITTDTRELEAKIPNAELREIFEQQVVSWVTEDILKDGEKLARFCAAAEKEDALLMEEILNGVLRKMIHIHDTRTKSRKENLYQGILLGFLSYRSSWSVESNTESGDGYTDIQVEALDGSLGIVIEVRYPAKEEDLAKAASGALDSLRQKGYIQNLLDDGVHKIITYGISCHLKTCRVLKG